MDLSVESSSCGLTWIRFLHCFLLYHWHPWLLSLFQKKKLFWFKWIPWMTWSEKKTVWSKWIPWMMEISWKNIFWMPWYQGLCLDDLVYHCYPLA